ncbi:hypothetical protein GJ744_005962 [Endocarpon pusillum]|uniref:Uncharacterized protein n=1 Tax=Endocarpon pusillum TaxID=364733 RepID=A0A8H7A7I1_9EURO|nr:hypothetical protein GJ744_005962 [Endocarpon pusillum]
MPPTQPPDPPNDSIEATGYAIKDKVYFLLYGKWRIGEIQDHGGSSEESGRYLIQEESSRQIYKIAACDMRKRGNV